MLRRRRGRVLNVSRMAMHAPDALWGRSAQARPATVYEATLDERLRELPILRVAYLLDSAGELFTTSGSPEESRRHGGAARCDADRRLFGP